MHNSESRLTTGARCVLQCCHVHPVQPWVLSCKRQLLCLFVVDEVYSIHHCRSTVIDDMAIPHILTRHVGGPSHCLYCSSTGSTCTQCSVGYYLLNAGSCSPCTNACMAVVNVSIELATGSANCNSCSASGCSWCNAGYYLSGTTCAACAFTHMTRQL